MAESDVLHVLGNEYNPEILQATHEPRSAQQLSDELDVPIATCYRRIEELTDTNLIELHDRPLSEEHRRVKVYRRCIDAVHLHFNEDDYSIEVVERTEIKSKLDDVWRSLADQ